MTGSSSRVKSAERVLAVLDLLARHAGPVTTAAVSSELELPKSTTHHLLNVMLRQRYVAYWPDIRMWTLGVAAFEIGAAYHRSGHLQHAAQRYLSDLTARTGHTSHLAVLQGNDVIYLDKREPRGSGIRLVTDVGTRLPAHLTAVGRSLLSTLGTDALVSMYTGYDWPQRTDVRVASLGDLLPALDDVRRQGYALELGATTDGIECIAAPVLVADGSAVAAVGIAMVAGTGVDASALTASVLDAARSFSNSLTNENSGSGNTDAINETEI
ncbi:IclR family transcriptional regulator [Kineosporia succinea]|uniref:DNA-binding IclR family transcriptional regulator n=1 Tax=Kineosporia succinea TaxID=84632 RepID=A0ABT9PDY6_9ACTN|nr:IclR family transcriptional regulator [Kineosporia succinea]MDP9830687.1 DNA-binding IclR family transcriptional regulator [Kineosporia succinea]